MRETCVIFDVDGTLVDSTSFDDELYGRAVREVLGDVYIRSDWSDYEHKTDSGILREICRENGIEADGCEAKARRRFGQLIAAYLQEAGACPAIAGGPALVARLRKRSSLQVAIATGGWRHTALMKLEAAGYDTTGLIIASADDAFARAEILEIARKRLPRVDAAVYVGDGEWDRVACESLGWRFIGVGERLRGRCTRWVADFSSDEAISAFLDGFDNV